MSTRHRNARESSILSIPNDVLQLIAIQSAKLKQGTGDWCKLASSCKRLWLLKLPAAVHSWSIPSTMKVEGEPDSRLREPLVSIVHEVYAVSRS